MRLFRNIILTLISIGLLWNFQISATSNSSHENSAIVDALQDEESSEKENCELENWKFLNQNSTDFKILKLSLAMALNEDDAILKYSSSVPTTPPDARA